MGLGGLSVLSSRSSSKLTCKHSWERQGGMQSGLRRCFQSSWSLAKQCLVACSMLESEGSGVMIACCPVGMQKDLTSTAVSATEMQPEHNEPDAGKAATSAECRNNFSSWGGSGEIPPNVTLPTYQKLEGNEDGNGIATCSPPTVATELFNTNNNNKSRVIVITIIKVIVIVTRVTWQQ